MKTNYADSCNFKPIPAITPLDGYWQNGTWKFNMSEITAGAVSQPSWQDIILSGNGSLTLSNAKANGLNYLKLFGGCTQTALPRGYTQLDSITFDGACYFDTGIVIDSLISKVTLIASFATQTDTSPCMMWGFMGDTSRLPRWGVGHFESKWLTSANATTPYGTSDTSRHTFFTELYDNSGTPYWRSAVDGTYLGGGVIASYSRIEDNTLSVYIGARNNNETAGNFAKGNFTYLEIEQDGVVEAKIYPCKRNWDNTLGLYNTVTNEFLTKQGTGTLTAGSTTLSPSPDNPIDIVSNNGVIKYGQYSNNIFNKDDTANMGNWYSSSSKIATAGSNATLVMRAIPNATYYYKHCSVTGGGRAFYTEVEDWTTGSDCSAMMNNTIIDKDEVKSITVSANAKWVFFNYGRSGQTATFEEQLADYMVSLTELTSATPYEPYRFGLHVDGTVETVEITGKNLYNKANGVLYGYPSINGVWKQGSSENSELTIMVKLNEGETYTATRLNGGSSAFRIQASTTATLTNVQSLYIINNTGDAETTVKTFTVPIGYPYVLFYVRNTYNNNRPTAQEVINAFQVELGSTATTYEPYYNGGSATAEMLLKVGDYQDVQNVLDGEVTRNVGIKVLDGTENWTIQSGDYPYFRLDSDSLWGVSNYSNLSTHFSFASISISSNNQGIQIWKYSGTGKTRIGLRYDSLYSATYANIPLFKQWLADQYANGTPVIIVCQKATATTETVTAQPLTIQAGTNIVEITQASIENLPLEVSYKSLTI